MQTKLVFLAALALVATVLIVGSFHATPMESVELEQEATTQMLDGKEALLDKMDDENENARSALAKLRKIQKLLLKKIDKKTSVVIDTVSNKSKGKRGPPGPRGHPGPVGRAGKTGPEGAQGPQGSQGPEGPKGPQGVVGPQGRMGPVGAEGARGFKGEPGPQGFRGRKGPRGDEGLEGERGAIGAPGPRGNPGAIGLPGAPGPEGKVGPNGPEGPRGGEPHRGEHADDGLMLVSCQGECCRLNVQYNGEYGSICDDGFTDQNAFVACRQLGFSGGRKKSGFGGGSGHIWLSGVRCGPTDARIQDCEHRLLDQAPGCNHNNDVGVCCTH